MEGQGSPCLGENSCRGSGRGGSWCVSGVAGSAGDWIEGSIGEQKEMSAKDHRGQVMPDFCVALGNLDLTLWTIRVNTSRVLSMGKT